MGAALAARCISNSNSSWWMWTRRSSPRVPRSWWRLIRCGARSSGCECPLGSRCRRGRSRCAARPLLALRARSDPVSKQAGRRAPQRVAVTLPESTFGCADQRRGSCCATRPLLTAFGRTPAANAAAPGGGLLRCRNPRLGSLFAAQDQLRREREPQKPRKRLISDPHRGSRRPVAGVRPSASEKGGRCTTRTLSLNPREKRARRTIRTFDCATATNYAPPHR